MKVDLDNEILKNVISDIILMEINSTLLNSYNVVKYSEILENDEHFKVSVILSDKVEKYILKNIDIIIKKEEFLEKYKDLIRKRKMDSLYENK